MASNERDTTIVSPIVDDSVIRSPRATGPAAPSPREPTRDPKPPERRVARAPAIIVAIIVAAIVGLSLRYLVQPQPLIIQGEADAPRIDIAAGGVGDLFPEFQLHATHQPGAYSGPVEASNHTTSRYLSSTRREARGS